MTSSRFSQELTAPGTEDVRPLALQDIKVLADLYSREYFDSLTVQKYAALYEEDAALLPPLDIFTIAGHYVLADGLHRYHGAKEAGLTTVPCRIFTGTEREAFLHAVRVNGSQHGLAYQPHDYIRIIRWFLADEEMAALSHREMARRIGCSHTYVDNIAREVEAQAAVAQALATVATHARNPKAQERQQLAGLLDVPMRAVRSHMTSWYKERLKSTVADGKTVEEAIKVVRQLVPSGGQPVPDSSVPQEAPAPPPAEAVVALGAALADTFLQQARFVEGAWPPPPSRAEVMALLTATLLADPSALTHTNWTEVPTALELALEQVWATTQVYIDAIHQWRLAFHFSRLTPNDPATLVSILEHLTAQRYQHPPAMARTIGNAITALEAYLAEHAPTSTTYPARHEVEL